MSAGCAGTRGPAGIADEVPEALSLVCQTCSMGPVTGAALPVLPSQRPGRQGVGAQAMREPQAAVQAFPHLPHNPPLHTDRVAVRQRMLARQGLLGPG